MATGTLGTPAMLAANVQTLLYTVSPGTSSIANINLCNITKLPVLVSIGITRADTPGGADWLEFDTYLAPAGDPANGHVLERTALALESGLKVFVSANAAGAVSARAYGVEKA